MASIRTTKTRWLALGGGGYDIGVVPRAWALAFAVMSGQSLPDELPPGYRARYGGERLYDSEELYWAKQSRRSEAVQAVVEEVK